MVARQWFERIDEGWPAGLSMDAPEFAPLLQTLGEAVTVAVDGDDAPAVEAAFQRFRRGFGLIWRARRSAVVAS